MESKTIEETIISPLQQRAIDYCDKKQMPKIGRQIAVIAYMHGATEQDRIARQEEREKACELYRKELMQIVRVMNISSKGSGELIDIDGSINDFRKAMEGGEE